VPKRSPGSGREVGPEGAARSRDDVSSASQETVPPGARRRFTASEKLRLVQAADAALATGKRGALEAMLRKEGIYSSLLSAWRRQLGAGGAAGLTSRKPGRKPKLTDRDRQLLTVTKENESLKRKLRVANALIGLQKNSRDRGHSACWPETPRRVA
jgi:transposase